MLIETRAATHKTTYLERGIDARLLKVTCERGDRGRLWKLKKVLELPGASMKDLIFADECPADRLTLAPHQQTQASL